jgi:undecaprenyl-diphosphatase
VKRLRGWLEPRILGLGALIAAALWLFIEVAGEVIEGDTEAVDTAILLALRRLGDAAHPLGPSWLEAAMRDITALGSPTVLGLIVAAVAVFLLLAGRLRAALLVLLATGGGGLGSMMLKRFFDRPRPDLFTHGDFVVSASFPSGHAMISAVVYLTLGALVARLLPSRRLKAYVMVVALLLPGLVGISRVYLGVHWPTDVLAGWVAGACWALACWLAAEAVKVGRSDGA